MWSLFRRGKDPVDRAREMQGLPSRLRLKTYSADSGYVYQYVYRGHRNSEVGDTREFVFSACRDGKEWKFISVHLGGREMTLWETESGRILADAEPYAIAKLALFEFLDGLVDWDSGASFEIAIQTSDIARHLNTLGRS